jgi:hypothetical protein
MWIVNEIRLIHINFYSRLYTIAGFSVVIQLCFVDLLYVHLYYLSKKRTISIILYMYAFRKSIIKLL